MRRIGTCRSAKSWNALLSRCQPRHWTKLTTMNTRSAVANSRSSSKPSPEDCAWRIDGVRLGRVFPLGPYELQQRVRQFHLPPPIFGRHAPKRGLDLPDEVASEIVGAIRLFKRIHGGF
jgi:hypothetical protein